MKILYVAEIVGKPGLHCLKTTLPAMKRDRNIDLVIANGDSVTGGFGLGKNHSITMKKMGVDVITGGDQLFFKKDMTEHIGQAPWILRPANLCPDTPGRGWRHYTISPGETELPEEEESEEGGLLERVAVISLLGQSGFDRIHGSNPYTMLSSLVERLRKRACAIILDFHATTTAEKYTMFHHADGMVTAVIGSGQRVQTADAQVMPSGTAVICDAGRTGSRSSVGGFAPGPEIKKYLSRLSAKSEESWEDLQLQGVLLEVDSATGYLLSFEALQIPCQSPA
ncbi:hypothetical protein SAMN05920897_11186 [Alkalispirochaeta americana]|uniref:Metallophosphoesterase n=1 Tax=Alkalispirochaeta americana TaxID=159291 RepID=A0A1N6U3P8_9SPIO|nr:TIGR00282 family metallophosphoesterase [Alkalispirochaeta americana]SIQ59956.1 hypothetical protein SAMN05920897_11186 [Alkalispirochaeta americana]